jgi:cysteine desulfurase
MGLEPERALAALRLSLGRWSTLADITTAVDLIARAASGRPEASDSPTSVPQTPTRTSSRP